MQGLAEASGVPDSKCDAGGVDTPEKAGCPAVQLSVKTQGCDMLYIRCVPRYLLSQENIFLRPCSNPK